MYVHSFSYLVNKLELGGYTYLQLKKKKKKKKLITILKNKGPMTEPCGTPIDIGLTWETISPICTNCLRLLR